jgi:dihydrofolate synthase/folylpolyglutamate synthase
MARELPALDYAGATRFLYTLERGSVKLGLERIRAAIEARGHPERRYATVHVAGTNGKGSTCALLASMLEAAGHRTGLLTSPHLLEYNERVRIGGAVLPRREVVRWVTELRPLITRLRLSYFEATTLLAFEAFARHGVSIAVIEVGMGGRLDATNVVDPVLTVVTGIDLDHTQALGRTRERIAAEKAGIMKPGVPLLLGPCRRSVRRVFERHGARLGAPVVALEDRVVLTAVEPRGLGTRFAWRRADGGTGALSLPLCGAHQAQNALLAVEAARLLGARGWSVPAAARRRGIQRARWPGRFQVERARGRPTVVFDVAHNPQGAAMVGRTWKAWLPQAKSPALLVGMLGDKDQEGYLRGLRGVSRSAHLVPLDSPRAGPLPALARAARRAGLAPQVHRGIREAWEAARRGHDAVLITGSFLTVEAGMRLLGVPLLRHLFGGPASGRGRERRARRHAR